MISFMISHLTSHMNLQVDDAEKALKMKIRPKNAFLSCYKLNFLAAMPREELHQFLIGLYGEYIIPSAFHSIKSVLRSENFGHQGPEHGHIDNCKKLANCTNNKDVYLTVLRAHAREGHLQYLRSLEADLADAEQDEGDDADESVPASSIDKEGEAGACELGIRYPTLQSLYAGKLNKQSIQANIIYDIIDFV